MEYNFAFFLIFLEIYKSQSQDVTSWNSVQISTCDAPLYNKTFSICCFTEKLPNDTIISFSNNFGHVATIEPPCRIYWHAGVERKNDLTSDCNKIGNVTVYNLTIHGKFLQDYVENTFECGYYVIKREMKITVLDNHVTSLHLPDSNPELYYKLPNGLTSNVRLYILQSNVTLLQVDQENNVTYQHAGVTFNGNVNENNFSAKILKLQRLWNGTYVCEYTINTGVILRDGITVVVLGKPKAPEITISTWKVLGNGIFGNVTCDGISNSAAPLFYKPSDLVTQWIFPSIYDWPMSNNKYLISTNGSSANVSISDCNKTKMLPIYCKMSENSLISDKSFGFSPNVMCSNGGPKKPLIEYVIGPFFIVVTISVLLIASSIAWRRRQERNALIDGLPSDRDIHSDEVQHALERIAMEESRQNYELHSGQSSGINADDAFINDENEEGAFQPTSVPSSMQNSPVGPNPRGAEGNASRAAADGDKILLEEVESLLNRHQRQLGGAVISLRVSRVNILENLISYYTDKDLAKSHITVKFIGEEGLDAGGVTNDMFTTFWYRAQEEFFIGCEAVVPYLPPHRFTDDSKYRVLGRMLSHSIAVTKEFPIQMCKSTIIAMINETTEFSAEVLLEDFLYFLDNHDRTLVTMAINDYSRLTCEQLDELMTIFQRYEYVIRITAENFRYHVTQMARHVLCIRPKPLLDKMREGIPQSHMEKFWSNIHLKALSVLFRALKPTPERVIALLKTSSLILRLTQQQQRVFGYLKDLLKEMTTSELETFLHFITGKKSIPRDKITIEFTTETGNLRLPKAHTCSNMMELPASYEDYDTFRSELKHLLASDEALKMSMA